MILTGVLCFDEQRRLYGADHRFAELIPHILHNSRMGDKLFECSVARVSNRRAAIYLA